MKTSRNAHLDIRWIGMRLGFVGLLAITFAGCNRGFYRRSADHQTYSIVSEKGAGPSWTMLPGFTINPDQRSRFADPTSATNPALPVPAPQLYQYQLPMLVTPDPEPRKLSADATDETAIEGLPPLPDAARPSSEMPADDGPSAGSSSARIDPHMQVSSLTPPEKGAQAFGDSSDVRQEDQVVFASTSATPVVGAAETLHLSPSSQQLNNGTTAETTGTQSQDDVDSDSTPAGEDRTEPEEVPAGEVVDSDFGQGLASQIPPLPQDAWDALPAKCLRRMLEFESVRIEYERSFKVPVEESQLDPAQRVNLENILELALINSRDFQTRKETLYRTALRLTLERFDYDLKFLRRGNGTSADYVHNRSGGIEVNTLGIPTGIGLTKSLYTAGELVARFANDVVLTFNGPTGYSSSVNSRLVFDLTQPLIQRDIRFESLTQAERDVVYAARDFVRFRKLLFRDLATRYYDLLLTYRSIAINTQDYLSNLDGFNRAVAVFAVGRIPSFQVDQFEQNVLRSRGNLINSCNSLERALDSLKLQIGLPVEMPLNVDLSELESLTLSDESTVIREQIRRKRLGVEKRLEDDQAPLDAIPLAQELAQRMLNLMENRVKLGLSDENETRPLKILVALLQTQYKRIEVRENSAVLQQNPEGGASILPAQVLLRVQEELTFKLDAIKLEVNLLDLAAAAESPQDEAAALPDNDAEQTARKPQATDDLLAGLRSLRARFESLRTEYAKLPNEQKAQEIPRAIDALTRLLDECQQLEEAIAQRLLPYGLNLIVDDEALLDLARSVVEQSASGLFAEGTSLTELEVDFDEAVLTALVQRLDLMNRRGELADAWRQIKLTGDDLKSILNVRANQTIRTRSGNNNPFDFTFDDSTTRLTLDFDTPLNRRVERNNFRAALINYNVALRTLMRAEDEVKIAVRDDLRAIELDQNQYEIAVASAALAYERVTSTRLQYTSGLGNINARDFLEAQQAYTASLSSVAQQHIGYVQDRIQFFLNLEQLQIDQLNFWPELRDEDYPFVPNTDFGGTSPSPYGLLPRGPWFSKHLRRMERIPPGQAAIHRAAPEDASQ